MTGNLKFDVELPAQLLDEARALRGHWGADRPVWIAASTHPGEERKVLDAFAELKRRYPQLLLVLVPRHPERFHAVARLCRQRGYAVALRSRTPGGLPPGTEVLVGDTMGELQRLYAAADVAYIGGSLVPHGGQNLLEACAVHVPVVFGPHMFHFEEISAMALERGAARQVHDVQGLVAALALVLRAARLAARRGQCRPYARDGEPRCSRPDARARGQRVTRVGVDAAVGSETRSDALTVAAARLGVARRRRLDTCPSGAGARPA